MIIMDIIGLNKLFIDNYDSIKSVLRKYTENCEDLINDTYLKLYSNMDKYNDRGYFRSYFIRTAINQIINEYRKKKVNGYDYYMDLNLFEYDYLIDHKIEIIKGVLSETEFTELMEYYDKAIETNNNSTKRARINRLKIKIKRELKQIKLTN